MFALRLCAAHRESAFPFVTSLDSGTRSYGEVAFLLGTRAVRHGPNARTGCGTGQFQHQQPCLFAPLIGAFDSKRSTQLTEQLLRAIRDHRARAVVIDLTGVSHIESPAANRLVQCADAARLLGDHVILTGISREMAAILINLATDVSEIITTVDLASGIERVAEVFNGR